MKRLATVSLLIFIIVSSNFAYANNLIKNGNNLIYDADLDITWYYDPNISAIDWYAAMQWAENLETGGATDWRLPFAFDQNPYDNIDTSNGGELKHLYFTGLGNTEDGFTNSFPFDDLQTLNYWTNTLTEKFYTTEHAYAFSFKYGYMGHADTTLFNGFGVLFVHPGNIGAEQIPEPGVLVLLAAGFAGLVIARRKLVKQ